MHALLASGVSTDKDWMGELSCPLHAGWMSRRCQLHSVADTALPLHCHRIATAQEMSANNSHPRRWDGSRPGRRHSRRCSLYQCSLSWVCDWPVTHADTLERLVPQQRGCASVNPAPVTGAQLTARAPRASPLLSCGF